MPADHAEMNLLCRGEVLRDASKLYVLDETSETGPPDEPGWIVPIALWAERADRMRERTHRVGILLQPDDNLDALEEGLAPCSGERAALIAINFPSYTDGRGYSLAQMVRRLGWKGELRAIGDVLVDNVHYLARCGFDSFLLKPGHDARKAAAALRTFSTAYQRAYRQTLDAA